MKTYLIWDPEWEKLYTIEDDRDTSREIAIRAARKLSKSDCAPFELFVSEDGSGWEIFHIAIERNPTYRIVESATAKDPRPQPEKL